MNDDYLKALQRNKKNSAVYYAKSFKKTEQQKFLENLLSKENQVFKNIGDIACGGGSLSFHLSKIYPEADFTLIDYNENALEIARKSIIGDNFNFYRDSIYELKSVEN